MIMNEKTAAAQTFGLRQHASISLVIPLMLIGKRDESEGEQFAVAFDSAAGPEIEEKLIRIRIY